MSPAGPLSATQRSRFCAALRRGHGGGHWRAAVADSLHGGAGHRRAGAGLDSRVPGAGAEQGTPVLRLPPRPGVRGGLPHRVQGILAQPPGHRLAGRARRGGGDGADGADSDARGRHAALCRRFQLALRADLRRADLGHRSDCRGADFQEPARSEAAVGVAGGGKPAERRHGHCLLHAQPGLGRGHASHRRRAGPRFHHDCRRRAC